MTFETHLFDKVIFGVFSRFWNSDPHLFLWIPILLLSTLYLENRKIGVGVNCSNCNSSKNLLNTKMTTAWHNSSSWQKRDKCSTWSIFIRFLSAVTFPNLNFCTWSCLYCRTCSWLYCRTCFFVAPHVYRTCQAVVIWAVILQKIKTAQKTG